MEMVSPVAAGIFPFQRSTRRAATFHDVIEDVSLSETEAPVEAGPAFSPLSVEVLEVLSNIDDRMNVRTVAKPRQQTMRIKGATYNFETEGQAIELSTSPLLGRRASDRDQQAITVEGDRRMGDRRARAR